MASTFKVNSNISLTTVDGVDYLLIERYDRFKNLNGEIQRLHQEDFCQALSIGSEMKYQNEGGPSLQTCFSLIREISNKPVFDLQQMLNLVIYNFLIGNNDAHGKNFSLIYDENGKARLAPCYDIVCTDYYPELSKKMAMKIGGEYDSNKILIKHFERFAVEANLAVPMVKKRVFELADVVNDELNKITINDPITSKLVKFFQSRCARLQKQL